MREPSSPQSATKTPDGVKQKHRDAEAPDEPSYEFSTAENEQIASLADRMRNVGRFLMVVGALSAVAALFSGNRSLSATVGYAVNAVFALSFGYYSTESAVDFRLIVDSEGSDIPNLMGALRGLSRAYLVLIVVCAIGLIAPIIAMVAGMSGTG